MADEFDDLDSNDDVFKTSNDGTEESYEPVVSKGFNGHVLNIDPNNAPGYLVDALSKYVNSFMYGDQNRIPVSSPVFKKVIDIANKFYVDLPGSLANQAVFNVLDRVTGGEVTVEYYKLLLEDYIVGYASLSRYINTVYSELERYVETIDDEEAVRCLKALFTYHDILRFHVDYYMFRYQTYCEENNIVPNKSVVEKQAIGESGVFTSYNCSSPNLDLEFGNDEKARETRRSVRGYVDSVMESSAKYIRNAFMLFKRDES